MKKFVEEFKEFALRGNVMDMAIGVIIGAAFSDIVTSLTDNFINPILKAITAGARYDINDIGGFASNFLSSVPICSLAASMILSDSPSLEDMAKALLFPGSPIRSL